MKNVDLAVRFARRFPNPLKAEHDQSEDEPSERRGSQRHVFLVPVEAMPDMPKDPNPREQNVDRGIWKDIRKHLLNDSGTPNTFHLKNKGITIVASKVVKVADDKYTLSFADGDGILDGGHTFELIRECQPEIAVHNKENPQDPISQFVKVEVLSGLDRSLLSEIAGGLNTAIQVQRMSLENLKGRFDWIKSEVEHQPYGDAIAFRENEPDAAFDVRDIIVLLDLFNLASFPNDGVEHPVRAYTSKANVLEHYVENTKEYEALQPILKDILRLFDTIRKEAPELHNDAGGKAGNLTFVENRARGVYEFPFLRKNGEVVESEKRLVTAASYPMLAAFRWCVELNEKTGRARWSMPFSDVLKLFRACAAELMRGTQSTNAANGRKANAIGRTPMHWANLHNIVAKRSLMMSRQ